MPKEPLFIVYLFNIFICFSIGILLLVIKTSPQIKQLMYHRAKTFLAVATIICGIGNGVVLIFGMENALVDFFSIYCLIISALQACMFTFLVLILFNSDYVKKATILKHLTPTFIFLFTYIIVVCFKNDVAVYSVAEYFANFDNPALLLRTAFAGVYITQLIIYTRLFLRERKIYISKIEDYFSDVSNLRLKQGTNLFFQALSVGSLVILFCFYPGQIQDFILTIIITVFYFGFAVSYINYQHTLQLILPTVGKIENQNLGVVPDEFDSLAHKLDALSKDELIYLKPGLVLDDIALRLKVSKRTLSNYLNTSLGVNFNYWINSLRIEYAKGLIASCPEYSLLEIAERSGFADSAMFSKEFKRHTGESPSTYRKKITEIPK